MEQPIFTAAVERYQDTAYRIALNMLRNVPDAEDAVQEVFLRLYASDKDFASDEYLRRWLIRVTLNVCKDMLRSPWRKRRVSLDELPETPAFEQPEHALVYEAVMSLPEKYRIALYLFYYEELSVREIGELLKLRPTAVTTRLSRARGKLKAKLTEVWQDEK